MSGDSSYSPYLLIGKLSRDFIITNEGMTINDIPGGHLLYSAIGMTPWEKNPSLIARVGKNYPESFLEYLSKYHFNTRGIKRVDQEIEHRNFISYYKNENIPSASKQNSVLSQYYYAGKPFPRDLLGYNNSARKTDSITERTSETILARDISSEFLEARCIHLCPLDYLSHNLLPQAFLGGSKRTITIQAGNGYMQPYFYSEIKPLVNGLSSFIATERQIKNLFSEQYKINNIADMMLILIDYGAENVVIKSNNKSYLFVNTNDKKINQLSVSENERWDQLGHLSCFCGAYIIGLNETYDYQKAAAYGAARASLLQNEYNPFNNLNILDSLLKEKIRIMEGHIEG